MNVAELISDAMVAVERCGASPEITEAIFLLAKAREHVAALEQANFERVDKALESSGDRT